MWGMLAVPLFDINTLGSGGQEALFGPGIPLSDSLIAQCLGILVIPAWTGVLSLFMFYGIKTMGLLRVERAEEEMGLDAAEFSPKSAYKGNVQVEAVLGRGASYIGSNNIARKISSKDLSQDNIARKISSKDLPQKI
jgi:hypothetical protein